MNYQLQNIQGKLIVKKKKKNFVVTAIENHAKTSSISPSTSEAPKPKTCALTTDTTTAASDTHNAVHV